MKSVKSTRSQCRKKIEKRNIESMSAGKEDAAAAKDVPVVEEVEDLAAAEDLVAAVKEVVVEEDMVAIGSAPAAVAAMAMQNQNRKRIESALENDDIRWIFSGGEKHVATLNLVTGNCVVVEMNVNQDR